MGLSKSFKMPHILALGMDILCQKWSFLRPLKDLYELGKFRAASTTADPIPVTDCGGAGDPSTRAPKPAWITAKWVSRDA